MVEPALSTSPDPHVLGKTSLTARRVFSHSMIWRHRAFKLYPTDVPLGFDLVEYLRLCAECNARADRHCASKSTVGFGEAGRQRQRAYRDALRDLVTPSMGHPPLVRVPAPDRDGHAAYGRVRTQMQDLAR